MADNKKNAARDAATSKAAEIDSQLPFPIGGQPVNSDSSCSDSKDSSTTSAARRMADAAQTGATAEETFKQACDWVKNNPDAAIAFAASIMGDVRAGRRASAYRARENVRQKCYLDVSGKPTKTCNSTTAYLERMLLVDFPEAAPYIDLGRSKADTITLCGLASLLDDAHKREYLAL